MLQATPVLVFVIHAVCAAMNREHIITLACDDYCRNNSPQFQFYKGAGNAREEKSVSGCQSHSLRSRDTPLCGRLFVVIHDTKMPGSSLPTEVTDLLGALTTRKELVACLPVEIHTTDRKARNSTPKSARAELFPECDEDEIDGFFREWRGDKGPDIAAEHFVGAPARGIFRAIRGANQTIRGQLTSRLLARWKDATGPEEDDWLVSNVRVLSILFGFTTAEQKVALLALSFGALQSRDGIVGRCVRELFGTGLSRRQAIIILGKAVDLPVDQLAIAFESTAALRSSGLLAHTSLSSYDLDDALGLSQLGHMFATESFASELAVRQRILQPMVTANGPELVLSHLSKKRSDIEALIRGAIRTGATGVNLLLYGPPGTGKTEFVKKLANDLKVDCYEVGYTADDCERWPESAGIWGLAACHV